MRLEPAVVGAATADGPHRRRPSFSEGFASAKRSELLELRRRRPVAEHEILRRAAAYFACTRPIDGEVSDDLVNRTFDPEEQAVPRHAEAGGVTPM